MEEWKDITGYEGLYQISNLGRVKTLRTNKIMRQEKIRSGYLRVMLSNNGNSKRFLVHRLVAQEFITNPSSLPEVNHKDENKLNNTVENLEWCSRSYNVNYGTMQDKINKSRCKKIKCIDTGEIFNSIREAAKKYNVDDTSLVHHLKNKDRYKTVAGYTWEYYKED